MACGGKLKKLATGSDAESSSIPKRYTGTQQHSNTATQSPSDSQQKLS